MYCQSVYYHQEISQNSTGSVWTPLWSPFWPHSGILSKLGNLLGHLINEPELNSQVQYMLPLKLEEVQQTVLFIVFSQGQRGKAQPLLLYLGRGIWQASNCQTPKTTPVFQPLIIFHLLNLSVQGISLLTRSDQLTAIILTRCPVECSDETHSVWTYCNRGQEIQHISKARMRRHTAAYPG